MPLDTKDDPGDPSELPDDGSDAEGDDTDSESSRLLGARSSAGGYNTGGRSARARSAGYEVSKRASPDTESITI